MALNKKNISGFSLIELSVVITVGAVLMTGGLVLTVKNMDHKRAETSEKRLQLVMQAIDDFVDEFGYLPCPADPAIGFIEANFGIGGNSGTGTCNSSNIKNYAATNVYAGVVPVTTLNIAPNYITDGWYRRITYIVDGDLTFAGIKGINGYANGAADGITIENYGGTAITTSAAVTLLSHGTNGYGAWSGHGSATQIDAGGSSDTKEDENDEAGVSFDNVFVQSVPIASGYDDIVEYITITQLNGVE